MLCSRSLLSSTFHTHNKIDSMLLNMEKKDPREAARNEGGNEEKEKPFLQSGASPSPPHLFFTGSREESGRPLTPWAEGRSPDEENEENERSERGTDRSARERNSRLPWLPSHSRLASLPWRWRHPFPRLSSLLFSLFVLSLSLFRLHTDRHSHTREIPSFLLSGANLLFDDKGRLAL